MNNQDAWEEMMELTSRLEAIAQYVGKDEIVADVGTDHGYIPIYLAKKGISKKVYAMDINKGPLEKAKENIAHFGVSNIVEPILSDGLKAIGDRVIDTVIIAGMGGMLVSKILTDTITVINRTSKLILSPHLDSDVVRRTIHEIGFKIVEEQLIEEDNKYYNIIIAEHGEEKYSKDIYYKYSKLLIERKNDLLKKFLDKKKNKNRDILKHLKKQDTRLAQNRILEIIQELDEIEEVMECL